MLLSFRGYPLGNIFRINLFTIPNIINRIGFVGVVEMRGTPYLRAHADLHQQSTHQNQKPVMRTIKTIIPHPENTNIITGVTTLSKRITNNVTRQAARNNT